MSYGIRLDKITKKYNNFTALDAVDLQVEPGEVYGLIGRNGAGKTTILKVIAGLALPTSGSVSFPGSPDQKVRIGALIEDPGLYPNLSAKDNIRIKLLSEGCFSERESDRLLALAGLSDVQNKKVKYYSLGMRQRLGIVLALAGEPDILLLDEPMNGLDPQGIIEVRNLVLQIRSEFGKTIVISSHILEELQKTATIFGIIDNGRLVSESREDELAKKLGGYIILKADPMDVAKTVLESMGIYSYQSINQITIRIMEQIDRADEILKNLIDRGVRVFECSVQHDSIEDYFVNVTGGRRA